MSEPATLTIGNETKTLEEWCKQYGISRGTVWYRVKRGMSYEQALKTPIRGYTPLKQTAPAPPKAPNMKRCKKCIYHGTLGNSNKSGTYCDYIGVTQHRRPCPPGEDCTVFKQGPSLVKAANLKRQKMKTW